MSMPPMPKITRRIEILLDKDNDPVDDIKNASSKYVTLYDENGDMEDQYSVDIIDGIDQEFESKCPDCGEDVALSGDHGRADVGKKKKKIAKVPRGFEFNEALDEHWQSITEVLNQRKLAKIWGELKPSQRRDLLKKLKVDTKLADLDFNDLSDANKTTLSILDKTEFASALTAVLGVGLAGLALNILDAPIDKPVSKIKDEPIQKDDPVNIKVDDRQPSFNQPSSFVGQVEYFPEDLSMEVLLNGKLYAFCNVSERLYDSFEGAGSKGVFFNREIKTLHDC